MFTSHYFYSPSSHPTAKPSYSPSFEPSFTPSKAPVASGGTPSGGGHSDTAGTAAGVVIGVLAIAGIAVGAYMHYKNKNKATADKQSLVKNMDTDEPGVEDDHI